MHEQNNGDVIHLQWEYEPQWFSVRGHVDFNSAETQLMRFYNPSRRKTMSNESELITTAIAKGHIAHVYARWSCDARMECSHTMYLYPDRGHGRFPVTVVAIEVDRVFEQN